MLREEVREVKVWEGQKQSQDSDEMKRMENDGSEDNQGQDREMETREGDGSEDNQDQTSEDEIRERDETEEKQGHDGEEMESSTSARDRDLEAELVKSKAQTRKNSWT